MKRRQVWQYQCDFCGRKKLSASGTAKHEKHCTMNPNRICRVCKMVADGRPADFAQRPLAELVAMLPDSTVFNSLKISVNIRGYDPFNIYNYDGGAKGYYEASDALEEETTKTLPSLREAAGNCPACIMAALRQAKIPVPMANGFSFTNEMKEIWSSINEAKQDRYY